MSKIWKKPIAVPEAVKISLMPDDIHFEGPLGRSVLKVPRGIKVVFKDGELSFSVLNESSELKARWGTTRALAQNAITGLATGFVKILEMEGVGYRAEIAGQELNLYVGDNHPVKFHVPDGIKVELNKNQIKVSGTDKYLVGETAARIRAVKKVEPYKGKGIKYLGEAVRRKEGKRAAAAGAAGGAAA